MANLATSTTDTIPGFRIARVFGLVHGTTAQFITARGGTGMPGVIESYRRGRADCTVDMLKRASEIGANAVIGIRYDHAAVTEICEFFAYGTAVWIEPA